MGKNKWTYEKCYEIAKTCKNRQELEKKSSYVARIARKNGWSNEWFGIDKGPKTKYTYDICKAKAQECRNRTEFAFKYSQAFHISQINGWNEDFFGENLYEKGKSGNTRYTYEICKELANGYISRSQFLEEHCQAYTVSYRNGWIDEFFPLKINDYLYEIAIEDYCKSHSIIYEREKKFPWLVNQKGKKLRIDFYLPKYNCAIECQGIQHFESVKNWGGIEKLRINKKNDSIKRHLCEIHKIKIFYYSTLKINFPYKVYNDIEELMKEITKDKTYEVCPYCGKEVEIDAELKVQKCPNCGKYIVTCSMCLNPSLNYKCGDCCLEILAHKLNEDSEE